MLQVSRRVDYALRAVLYLSQLGDGRRASVKQISDQRRIPQKFLEKVFKDLLRVDVVRSHRGVHGGYSLGRPAEEITFRDVIEAVEGPICLNVCVNEKHGCALLNSCTMHEVWQEGQRQMVEFFSRTTMADLRMDRDVNSNRRIGV